MFTGIIAVEPKMVPPWGSIVLLRLIKGNVKNLQVSDSGPLWPSCCDFFLGGGGPDPLSPPVDPRMAFMDATTTPQVVYVLSFKLRFYLKTNK